MAAGRPFRIAVLDDYQRCAERIVDWGPVRDLGGEVTFFHDHVDDWTEEWSPRLVERLTPFDVVVTMRERSRFPEAVLSQLSRLRLLCTQALGNASIDVSACKRLGIMASGTVYGGPRSSTAATAELAWTLLLACARRIPFEHAVIGSGGYMTTLGMDIEGRTLGILGLGNLGSRIAKYGQAFGMRVIAWSQNLTQERCEELGVERISSLEVLLQQADFVSVHVRQSSRTVRLLGATELGHMKPSAILVNTSRGPIVDEMALVAALESDPPQLAGYGADVFDIEPLPKDHALRFMDSRLAPGVPSVVLSPHIGYVTEDVYRTWYEQTVEDIVSWASTGQPKRSLKDVGYSVHIPGKEYPRRSKQ